MTVGLIQEPEYTESVLQEGRADLVAIGREALFNPQWPLHASVTLLGDEAYERFWQPRFGWWLDKRAHSLTAAAAEAEQE